MSNDVRYHYSCISFHPNGKILAVGSYRKTIALWDIDTGEILSHLDVPGNGSLDKIEFSNDGNWLVVQNNSVSRYDLSAGKADYIPVVDAWGMAITADSNYILTGSQYGKLRITDIKTRRYEERDVIDHTPPPNCGSAIAEEIAVSPNCRNFATIFNGSRLTIWDTDGFIRIKTLYGWVGYTQAFYLPKLNRIITGTNRNELLFWDATTGELVKAIDYYYIVEYITPSPDGKRIAICAEQKDYIYDALTGDEIYKFEDRYGHTRVFTFSPSGKYLASNGWKGTYIYDMKKGELIKWIMNSWLNCPVMFFTPDEKQIIIMPEDDDTKKVEMEFWDIESGELAKKMPYSGPMVRFGRDFIQARGNGDETTIYLLNSGMPLCKIPAKLMNGWYWDLVFHPSGDIMAFQIPTGEEDFNVHQYDFYNPWTGNLIASIPNISMFQFADDDYMFITDDKLELGLYRISDVLGTNPDDGISGNFLTQFGRIKHTELYQNYPNPFNPETWIPYVLADNAQVSIQIYSTIGQLIRTMNLGLKPAGAYISKDRAAYWDGCDDAGQPVASGIYFYSLKAGSFQTTGKMAVIR